MKSPHPIPEEIKSVAEAVHEHFKGVGELTVEQLQSALIQAIECGDFQRHVQESSSPISEYRIHVQEIYQAITYIPFRRVAELEDENNRLREALYMDEEPLTPHGYRPVP